MVEKEIFVTIFPPFLCGLPTRPAIMILTVQQCVILPLLSDSYQRCEVLDRFSVLDVREWRQKKYPAATN